MNLVCLDIQFKNNRAPHYATTSAKSYLFLPENRSLLAIKTESETSVNLHLHRHLDTKCIQCSRQRASSHVSYHHEHGAFRVVRFGDDLVVVIEKVKGLGERKCIFCKNCGLVRGGGLVDGLVES